MRSKKELKRVALHGMANWMETGDFLLSAADILQRNLPQRLKPLNYEQQKEVHALREMAEDPNN
jgi:hypothetical protein